MPPSKKPAAACKRNRTETTRKLLKAALQTFSQFGFSATTTKRIALRAKVNEGLITRYFDGKEGLLVAIIAEFQKNRETEGLSYPAQLTASAELTRYAESRLEKFFADLDFLRITVSQALSDPQFIRRVRSEVPLRGDPLLSERLVALKKAGKLKSSLTIPHIIEILDTQIMGAIIFMHLLMGESQAQTTELLLRAVQLITATFD
jgi:AcrR family transcriptional regulator